PPPPSPPPSPYTTLFRSDQAPEVASAGHQHLLEADAGAPAALEPVANRHPRAERQRDVEDEEDPPDQLADLEDAAVLERVGDVRSEEHTSELQSRENLVC